MREVIFRAAVVDGNALYPVRVEVSVDNGGTWHEVPSKALNIQESVDDVATATVEVFLLGHEKRYTGTATAIKQYVNVESLTEPVQVPFGSPLARY